MSDHPYGWLSLAPPLATVALAIATRRAIESLLAGVFVGALILTGGDPVAAAIDTLETHLWPALIDPFKLRVLGFTLLMGATIGVVNRSGGMHGLVGLVAPLARTRLRGQLVVWFTGLLVFFDDYTNTLLLGATMRPTCDRLRISREKLAYIVDSTAAPVAGIALLSTWVAVEIQFIQDGLNAVSADKAGDLTAVGIFLGCLPYRFYIIQALLFVPLLAILGRDFGPMRAAERAALAAAEPPPEPAAGAAPSRVSHWTNAVVPLGATLAVVLWLIVATGRAACRAGDLPMTLRNVFGSADSVLALFYGSLVGLGLAVAVSVGRKLLTAEEAGDAAFAGVRSVLPALAILWFASTMSGMTAGGGDKTPDDPYPLAGEQLYTGDFLQQQLLTTGQSEEGPSGGQRTLGLWLPTAVFVLSSIVAFCTGTSFGTMGIMMPVIAPIALASLGPAAGATASEPLLMAAFGGVLSGAIFGDHCSPISDTTILSSQSSGCDHVAHVVTQLPYALAVAVVTIVLGTAPLAMGVSVWLLLPLQTAALASLTALIGTKVAADTPAPDQSPPD